MYGDSCQWSSESGKNGGLNLRGCDGLSTGHKQYSTSPAKVYTANVMYVEKIDSSNKNFLKNKVCFPCKLL